MKGFFLTLEGIEGSGKSTQVSLLKEHLERSGYQVLVTREPGDGELGSRIRELLLSVSNSLDAHTELFLLAADRTQHVIEIIKPALNKGYIVICDRYADSSMAYQGSGRGLPVEFIKSINDRATGGCYPDLTLVLDLSPEVSIQRSQQRLRQQNMFEAEGRFEQESLAFHSRVRQGYLDIARDEPGRVHLVDGMLTIDELSKAIIAEVNNSLLSWENGEKL